MLKWTAPSIPARKVGWERAYVEALQKYADSPFVWGASDCLMGPADLCEAMTGVNPFPIEFRRYRTASGSFRVLKSMGMADVEEAIAAVMPRIPVAHARRGDVGVGEFMVRGRMVLATYVVMGSTALGKNDDGNVVVPTLRLRSAFKVG